MESRKCSLRVIITFVLSLSFFQPAQAMFLFPSIQAALLGGAAVAGIGGIGMAAAFLFDEDGTNPNKYYIGEAWPKYTKGTSDQVGWVFYCEGKEPCEHGLMIDDEVQWDEVSWAFVSGCNNTEIGTSFAVGAGENNTKKIIKVCSERPIAASVSYYYRKGGFDNWFLPSRDELLLAYENLKDKGVGGIIFDGTYWSSSECENYSSTTAYTVNFEDGIAASVNKPIQNPICAARAF